MSVKELLKNINKEDKTVPDAIEKVIPKIEKLVNAIVKKCKMVVDYSTWEQVPVAV